MVSSIKQIAPLTGIRTQGHLGSKTGLSSSPGTNWNNALSMEIPTVQQNKGHGMYNNVLISYILNGRKAALQILPDTWYTM